MNVLSVLVFVISFVFFVFVIRTINKNIISLQYALIWLLIGIIMMVFSIFPDLAERIAHALGFAFASNFVLFVSVMFCLVQLILTTSYISKQDDQIKKLIQEVSLLKKEMNEQNRHHK
ncbi:DUF2304 domain-containing protein [Vagococcus lutrae]|uniref:DUF2304 domain-containing protein n=1 Tax=Vagococcus lutrae TaxID=81947 RepID=UPI001444321B|nr:DUF2304 domain-containing protein [Vagococcus lutrae]MDT2805960.1 DUF2304 domain-containing protein [Vagococcus lutrae]MDT2823446.1 DUF2304 domain-containing protein [Vagococcus lutrae]MDY3706417.1 DUF2304 domain-containing protein [Vagococcus lutrae]NKZ27059.1 DUF2304 domain-containing protein [Vagococcus lutrae]UQF11036.1 DUF2304 domain-containing protein [Vagococcus lutrae]